MRPRHLLALSGCAAALIAPAADAAAATPAQQMLHQLNRVRVAHGLRRVLPSSGLRAAARRHTNDMLERGYFAHTSPLGSTLARRIERSPFVTHGSWQAGETLAWGSGARGSARATVRAWLRSPEHRAILLSPAFRWIGVASAVGRFHHVAHVRMWTVDWAHR